MPTRRHFIHSALLLPAALTQTGKATAQPPQSPSNPITPSPAFDFESGDYEG